MTWSAASGTIQLVLTDSKSGATISCSAADTGTMTVPANLLANFSTSDSGTLILLRSATQAPSDDNATIALTVYAATTGSTKYN
jgi:hypothetical protein